MNKISYMCSAPRRTNRGFSLVELVVVILIIAIISVGVAVAVVKYIPESQKAVCDNNKASLKTVLYAYMAEQNIDTANLTEEQATALIENGTTNVNSQKRNNTSLQDVIDEQDSKCPKAPAGNGEYEYKVKYDKATGFYIYCKAHDEENEDKTSTKDIGNITDMKEILNVIQAANVSKKSGATARVDSGATSASDQCVAAAAKNALIEAGFDFDQMNIKSWSYNGGAFYFSQQDISKMNVGDKTVVIKFNPDYNNAYTVWETTIDSGTTLGLTDKPFNIIGSTGKEISPSNDKTYENALKIYNAEIGKNNTNKN